MQNLITIPLSITQGLDKLNDLVVKHPQYIPLPEVASFLGADKDGLRAMIERGLCPFGIGWQKVGATRLAVKIPTVTFYLWYTQSACFKN